MGQLRQFMLDDDTVQLTRQMLLEARDQARCNAKYLSQTQQQLWLDMVTRYDRALDQITLRAEADSPKPADF